MTKASAAATIEASARSIGKSRYFSIRMTIRSISIGLGAWIINSPRLRRLQSKA